MRTVAVPSRGVLALLTCVVVNCHSADVDEQDAAPPLAAVRTGEDQASLRRTWVREDWWRPCRSDADCEKNHVCIDVDRRPKQTMLLSSFLEPRACALVVHRQALDLEPPPKPRYMNRLLLIQEVRFALSDTLCTLGLRLRQDGTVAECQGTCRGEQVWLSGFEGHPIMLPKGTKLECKDRLDCESPACPSWLKLDHEFEIAGAFHTVEEHEATPFLPEGVLTFALGTDPELWSELH